MPLTKIALYRTSLLADNLGIDYRTIAIEPAFAAYLDMLAPSFADKPADLTEENLQSRVRGMTLMALSNKFGWLVLATGNKSEMATGYSTLYGHNSRLLVRAGDIVRTGQTLAKAGSTGRSGSSAPSLLPPPCADRRRG